jgi:hypothetical protein
MAVGDYGIKPYWLHNDINARICGPGAPCEASRSNSRLRCRPDRPGFQYSRFSEKRGLIAEDALLLFPPTRNYTNAEIQKGLASDGIDGVLVINVGDTGVLQQYAGTILSGQYSGSSNANGTINTFGNVSTVSLSGTSSGDYGGDGYTRVQVPSSDHFQRTAT